MRPMESAGRLIVSLELDGTTEPVTGHVRVSGQEIPFVGWLGLMQAIETRLTEGRDQTDGRGGVCAQ
jgi:hypothetical protein